MTKINNFGKIKQVKKMNLKKSEWNQTNYKEYLNYLLSLQDKEYLTFQQKIVFTKYEMIGIRVPLQRQIAKEISKGNAQSFIKVCQNKYYEEVNIKGLVIAYLKDQGENYLDEFIKEIDNWAICDGFCSSLKIVLKNQDQYFLKIKEYLQSDEPYPIRVGLVLLLNYYVEEKYLYQIFALIKKIKHQDYYVKMAIAWLISICFIKFPSQTEELLKAKELDAFIQNKAISKIRDSQRISKSVKDSLLIYRK